MCISPIVVRRNGKSFSVPCRECMCCRIKKAQSLRFACDLFLYEVYKKGFGASFITLTYSNSSVPFNEKGLLTLRRSDFQKFQKRFRFYLGKYGFPLENYKYIGCGEYGDKFSRPHYHFLALGITKTLAEYIVPKAWSTLDCGISDVGALSVGGLNYVLKYCTKSSLGKEAKRLYDDNDVERPFLVHSRNLEKQWILDNFESIENSNYCYNFKGRLIPLPSYYRRKYDVNKQFDVSKINHQLKTVADSFGLSVADYSLVKSYNLERELVNKCRSSCTAVDSSSLDKAKICSSIDVATLARESFDPLPF